MKKCVIASDSFKETLSSKQITDLFAREFLEVFPNALLEKVVLADGGENTLEVFANHFINGKYHYLKVTGPNFQTVNAKYFSYDDIAVIELAEACGLSLTIDKNPLKTTTAGVGELIKDAYFKGFRKFYVALGGSSTNDGGCGLLSALGVKFFDTDNNKFVPVGGTIDKISRIDVSGIITEGAHFTILSDVKNPMYGLNGAAYVFARQKGSSDHEIKILDKNLRHLNDLFLALVNKDVSSIPGSGAAGAAASGMLALLDCEIVSGIETLLNLVDFDRRIKNADYVFTGEGRLDGQSFNGKLISGVLSRTKKQNIKTICVCGQNSITEIPNDTFYKVFETSDKNASFEQIKRNASSYYSKTIKRILTSLK